MESFFVIPFTIGLIFLIISLIISYARWFMTLRIRNKVRLKKALSIKWLVDSLAEVFRECLLHMRIFKVKRRLWYMHTSLAFGWFLLILAGNLETICKTGTFLSSPSKAIFLDFYIRGYLETGWLDIGFNYVMDILLIFVLSGLFLAIYKRFNAKLLGVSKTANHSSTDKAALAFLWLVFPARLIAEILNHTFYGGGGFFTGFLGNLIYLPENYSFLSDAAWLFYSSVLGGFFILLPFSRYMHIFTEIPHIFLKNANMEALHDGGITNFQVHACSLCGICLDACQMNVKTGLMGQSIYFLRNLRNGKKPKEDSVMNCLMCGRCKQVCPVQVDTLSIRMNERNRINGKMNYDFSYLDEASWPAFPSKIVFFGGCLTRLTPAITEAMKKIFMLTGEDFIFIDEYEAICCGRPLLLSGQYEAFREIANRTRSKILNCNPALIVTTCPICLNTFKNDYYYQVPVVHHSQYLNSLVKEGRFIPQRNGVKTVYHDPCELGRNLGIYSEPRNVLDLLVYLQNKDYTPGDGLCCGGSLADLELDVEEKRQIARETIEQIVTNDTQQLATSCPLCKMTFQMAGLYPVKDLAEIYAESMITIPVEKITANMKIRNYSNMPVNR